jgi:hypothetical protein
MGGVCRQHGDVKNAQKFWLESLKRDNAEDLVVDRRMVLKRIKKKKCWRELIAFVRLRIFTGGRLW